MAAMQAQRSAAASTSEQQEEEENCGPMPIHKLEVMIKLYVPLC